VTQPGGLPALPIGSGNPTLGLAVVPLPAATGILLPDNTQLTTALFKVRRGLLSLEAVQLGSSTLYPRLVGELKALHWNGPPLPVDFLDNAASVDTMDLSVLREARVKLWESTAGKGASAEHLAAEICCEISKFRRYQKNVFDQCFQTGLLLPSTRTYKWTAVQLLRVTNEAGLRDVILFSGNIFLKRGTQGGNSNNSRSRKGPVYEVTLAASAGSSAASSESASSTASMERVLSSFVTSERKVSLASVTSTVKGRGSAPSQSVTSTLLIRDTSGLEFLRSAASVIPDSVLDGECAHLDKLRTVRVLKASTRALETIGAPDEAVPDGAL
jgi:hypothetical protein